MVIHEFYMLSNLQAQLTKLPKNLLAKTSTIKNTGQVCKLLHK